MSAKPLYLTTHERRTAINVQPKDGHFEGTLRLDDLSETQRQLFTEFEEIVEGQILSLLDDVEGRIRECGFEAIWEDGTRTSITDLQVFPKTGAVSFRTKQPARHSFDGDSSAKVAIEQSTA